MNQEVFIPVLQLAIRLRCVNAEGKEKIAKK